MKKPNLSRRSFLKAMTYGAGAAIGTRLVGSGRGWEGEAKADDEKPALFVVYLRGGYNALFSAAGGLKGSFGVDDGNIEDRGNGLVIDAQTYGTFPDNVKSKLDIVPVRWIDKVLEIALERQPVPLTEEEPAVSAGGGKNGETSDTSVVKH